MRESTIMATNDTCPDCGPRLGSDYDELARNSVAIEDEIHRILEADARRKHRETPWRRSVKPNSLPPLGARRRGAR
jgi:hypothetical protein